MLQYLIARGKEASSYAGLGTLLTSLHIQVGADVVNQSILVATALAGLLAILIPGGRAASAPAPKP